MSQLIQESVQKCNKYLDAKHIYHLLENLTKVEFGVEQVQAYFSKKVSNETLTGMLCAFEVAKFGLRLKQFLQQKEHIFISEENPLVGEIINQQQNQHMRQEESINSSQKDKYSVKEAHEKITQLIEGLRNKTYLDRIYNEGYEETLQNSKKRIGVIQSLPLPSIMLEQPLPSIERTSILIGELIHIARPLVYCVALYYCGQESWTPYCVAIVGDFVKLMFQHRARFFFKRQKDEFIHRNRQMLLQYLFRNPFYSRVLKEKVIIKVLDRLIPERLAFIKSIIIFLIDLKSSLTFLM